MEDFHSWIQAVYQPLIDALRFIELLDLPLKHDENAARRVAVLELVSEWVLHKIVICALFVCFQCIIEN